MEDWCRTELILQEAFVKTGSLILLSTCWVPCLLLHLIPIQTYATCLGFFELLIFQNFSSSPGGDFWTTATLALKGYDSKNVGQKPQNNGSCHCLDSLLFFYGHSFWNQMSAVGDISPEATSCNCSSIASFTSWVDSSSVASGPFPCWGYKWGIWTISPDWTLPPYNVCSIRMEKLLNSKFPPSVREIACQ